MAKGKKIKGSTPVPEPASQPPQTPEEAETSMSPETPQIETSRIAEKSKRGRKKGEKSKTKRKESFGTYIFKVF